MRSLCRADVLVLDDWGLAPLDAGARHDLLELLEERYGVSGASGSLALGLQTTFLVFLARATWARVIASDLGRPFSL